MGKKGEKSRVSGLLGRAIKWLGLLLLAIVVLELGYAVVLKWVDPPLTFTQFGAVLEGHDFERDYVGLGEISPSFKLAVIASEDQRFGVHRGFDWGSIEQAIEDNSKPGASLRGGSNISQQTVKNVFLWQERSWLRKGLETVFTPLVELVWGKARILEVYLNVAEMGPGVFGAQAAARHYFEVDAADLDTEQAAALASVLPNPKELDPVHPSTSQRAKIRWIRDQMAVLATYESLAPFLKREESQR